ncbi:restriction endonuclease subunit S [Corynebacterium amycolatum]|uniref:restriction endonuclease subunit S n=2 Tax=Corynebacteriaceae TaxID=1653 RepID=UPI00114C8C33
MMQGQLDEWIGDLPAEWDAVKTKQLFRILKRQVPHKEQTILSITQQGIRPKNISENEGQMAGTYDGYQEVFVGDFAMNSMDLLTGWVDQSQYDGLTSPDYRVFAPIEPSCVHGPFYSYVFQSLYTRRVYYKYGQGVSNMGRWRLPAQTFLNFPLPHPAIEEQRIIAKFIESKTSEIDALVEKLVRQVELLERYRRELIARTVTRGLNPDVPMKDSGIEWIGRIPEHWSLEAQKRVMRRWVRPVGNRWGEYQLLSMGKPGVTVRDVESGKGKFPASFEDYQEVIAGDIVMCLFDMDETPRTVGLSSVEGMITGAYDVFRVVNGDERFVSYWLHAFDDRKLWKLFYRSLRKTITFSRFLSLPIPVPPHVEQRLIADYLDGKMSEIDSTVSGIRKQIELLGKYRKQIINDAVTGKVRVGEVA